MNRPGRLIARLLSGTADRNIRFDDLRALLLALGSPQHFKSETFIYWSDEDDAFIAEVPELLGCAADGGSQQEALTRLQLVAQEWIETARELGRPIPEPRGRLLFA